MNYETIALWSQILSSILFVVALIWTWNRFIQPSVMRAQENKNARISQAEHHRDQAAAMVESLRGEIDRARTDAEAIGARAASLARAEERQLLQETREAGDRAIVNAQGELGRELEAARALLREELLDKSLDLARLHAAQRVNPSVDERLVHSFVGSLREAAR